jgi:hypothetical protein
VVAESPAWKLFEELVDRGFDASVLEASLRTQHYHPGRGGEVIFEVLLYPVDRFKLQDVKRVMQLVEEHKRQRDVRGWRLPQDHVRATGIAKTPAPRTWSSWEVEPIAAQLDAVERSRGRAANSRIGGNTPPDAASAYPDSL